MSVKWTDEQREAIYAPVGKYNILVSADAGSGKTAVLVERICNMIIKEKISVENLLVVTFTNAAAAGMKSRIIKRLESLLGEINDTEEKARIREQISMCATADIMTIDAFCINVLKNNFHLAGISPRFYIMDKTEEALIKQTALEEMFVDLYRSEDEEEKQRFYSVIEAFSDNRSDDNLINIIFDIHSFAQSFAEPMQWVENAASYYDSDVENSEWLNKIYLPMVYQREVKEALQYMKGLCADLVDGENNDTATRLYVIVSYMQKLTECTNIEELIALKAETPDYTTIRKAQDDTAEVYNISAKILADIETSFPYTSINQLKEENQLEKMFDIAKALAWIVKRFDLCLESEKERRNAWTFSDIEHKVYELFKNSGLGLNKAYAGKYTEILIDEYQDTNGLQDSIFKSISRDNRNIFMVGDLKQSIYRFRGGDMSIFGKKFDEYTFAPQSDDIDGRLIVLSKNFRSSNEVLRGVDAQFKRLMTKSVGDVEYRCNNYDTEEKNTDLITEVKPVAYLDGDSAIRAEASYIARRIKQMVGTKIRISENEERVIGYGDFSVLMFAIRKAATIYTDEFKKVGIPHRVALSDFFDKREVKVVISLLSVLSNVKQDVPFVSLLMSPIFGFSGNDLAKVKCEAKAIKGYEKMSFYDTVTLVSQKSEDEEIKSRCTAVLERISRWRAYARIMSVAKLIWTIYEESGFYDYMGAVDGSEESQRNLRLVYERALGFERSGSRGLFDFVRYMENLRDSAEEVSGAKSNAGDSVSIMTIHSSKGLEFPIVFLAGMGHEMIKDSPFYEVVKNKELGLGIPSPVLEKQIYGKNIYTKSVRYLNTKETISESIRLLYVAMTRAQYKLINVVAFKTKDEDSVEEYFDKWREHIFNDYVNSRKKHFSDWVMPTALISPDMHMLETEIYNSDDESDAQEEIVDEVPSQELTQSIKELLDFEYKYKNSTDIPSRTSATELKRVQSIRQKNQHTIKKGITALDGEVDAAKRGTAYHNAISFVSLDALRKNLSEETIKNQLNALAQEGKINRDIFENDLEMPQKIYNFFANSSLGKRMLQIDESKIYREKNFQLAINAGYYKPDAQLQEGEEMILQGVIDCFYIDEERDEVVLIDYKTDSMKNKTKEDILEMYGIQLDLYTEAIEKIMGRKVTHRYLYLFDTDEAVEYMA